ncbi:MAG: RsmB/NOP family class I SAM-dependent RNA methyltransferase [Pseudomonadota bacterium]
MTPGARVQAAVEVLGAVVAGAPAERELTAWGRRARYAGSKDRAAVRDHVYDALRRLRSSAWLGGLGAIDGLAQVSDPARLMAGLLRGQGRDLSGLFTGQGHAPAPVDIPDQVGNMPEGVASDLPNWVLGHLRANHGDRAMDIAAALRCRAPVNLRANLRKTTREALMARLTDAGLTVEAHTISPTAIFVAGAPRGLTALDAFLDGSFELQDAGSQALVDRLPADGRSVLDLCAGGGGKALAAAAGSDRAVFAHDAEPERMRDLPARAKRAGVRIDITENPEAAAPFDGVIADVPCSGSGSWRRSPEARWRLDEAGVTVLMARQDAILDRAVRLVKPGGWVAYMTCSLLQAENAARVDARLVRRDVVLENRWDCSPLDDCDGFHLSVLRRV